MSSDNSSFLSQENEFKSLGKIFKHTLSSVEIQEFLAQRKPRYISKDIHKAFTKQGRSLGISSIFFAMGFIIFVSASYFLFPWTETLLRWSTYETVEGQALYYEKTDQTVQYNNGPKLRIYKIHIQFKTPEGKVIRITDYAEGERAIPGGLKEKEAANELSSSGSNVTILYSKSKPERAMLASNRHSDSEFTTILISGLTFFFSGFLFLTPFLYQFLKKRRTRHILIWGDPGVAMIESFKPTRIEFNEQPIIAVHLTIKSMMRTSSITLWERGHRLDYLRYLFSRGKQLSVLFIPDEKGLVWLGEAGK